jgi:hypothetical protein
MTECSRDLMLGEMDSEEYSNTLTSEEEREQPQAQRSAQGLYTLRISTPCLTLMSLTRMEILNLVRPT